MSMEEKRARFPEAGRIAAEALEELDLHEQNQPLAPFEIGHLVMGIAEKAKTVYPRSDDRYRSLLHAALNEAGRLTDDPAVKHAPEELIRIRFRKKAAELSGVIALRYQKL